ncbi:MAG: hypothetical protein ABI467_15605 [Kofleriaceae bacterium]
MFDVWSQQTWPVVPQLMQVPSIQVEPTSLQVPSALQAASGSPACPLFGHERGWSDATVLSQLVQSKSTLHAPAKSSDAATRY